jgi:hypothetical protein
VMAKTTACGAEGDIKVGTARAAETHRRSTDEFSGDPRSYLQNHREDHD